MFSCYLCFNFNFALQFEFFELQTDPVAPAIPSRKYASLQKSIVSKPGHNASNTSRHQRGDAAGRAGWAGIFLTIAGTKPDAGTFLAVLPEPA
jgi:hypothetical protein